MNKEIEYKGYTAVAYGHSSMSVFKNGQEVMHTDSRKPGPISEKDMRDIIDDYVTAVSALKEMKKRTPQT